MTVRALALTILYVFPSSGLVERLVNLVTEVVIVVIVISPSCQTPDPSDSTIDSTVDAVGEDIMLHASCAPGSIACIFVSVIDVVGRTLAFTALVLGSARNLFRHGTKRQRWQNSPRRRGHR